MSTTTTQAVPAGTWALDPVHSTIGFAVGYMAGTFTGSFGDFDSVVTDGVLTGSAKVASVSISRFTNGCWHIETAKGKTTLPVLMRTPICGR